MSKKVKIILARIALIFILAFTIFFIMFLFDTKMLNGVIATLTLITGIIGIGLFLTIYFVNKGDKNREEELKKRQEELELANSDDSDNSQEFVSILDDSGNQKELQNDLSNEPNVNTDIIDDKVNIDKNNK